MKINIGLSEQDRQTITSSLSRLLADTYTVQLKTQNFHWNVRGPMFHTLHQLFETQYAELSVAVDQIAERIRTLGATAPASYSRFSELTSIKDGTGEESADEMISSLVDDNETIVRTARQAFSVTEAAKDEASADLLTQRMQVHEKSAWMLRTLLDEAPSRSQVRHSESVLLASEGARH